MSEKIEHRIGIPVPAGVVWEILADVEGWPAWNPIYPKASGKVGFGERLTLTLALPDLGPREIAPVVFDWAPDEAIHWRTTRHAGLTWAVRFLEIEAMSDTACIVSNGEIYGGWFGADEARKFRRPLQAGFTALGEALKARAESLWRERGGGAK